jgi:hypothetical protein
VSADQWQLSLQQLYGTADALEAGIGATPWLALDVPVAAIPPQVAAPNRSIARVLVSSAVHCGLTVGVLLGGFALVDPILPHAERPHLEEPTVFADASSGAGRAIPPSGAYRP